MRAFEFAAGQPWATDETHLRLILDIAQRAQAPDMQAVAQKQADRQSGDGVSSRFGSVAVLNVIGPIFRYANLFTDISGATSVDVLAAAFREAVEDPSVSGVVLNIDSPGGEVAGISELATAIREARAVKPIAAYVDDMGASGAYWLASAAEVIVASDTAKVGSIGVVATLVRREDEPGTKTYEFVSSISPKKRPDLDTDEGKQAIMSIVDDLGKVFADAVAANRGTTSKKVVSDYGQGGLMVASRALAAGMIDEIGTFDGLIERMKSGKVGAKTKRTPASQTASVASATRTEEVRMPEQVTGTAEAQKPAVDVDKLVAEARAAGSNRASEIVDLCAIAGLSTAKAAEFLGSNKTAAEVRKELLTARADASGADLNTGHMPGVETVGGTKQQKPAKSQKEINAALMAAERGNK